MGKQEIFDALGYYVYALVDPRNKQIFYVGKGKNDRVLQHAKGIIDTEKEEGDTEKIALIKNIIAEGKEVEHYILRHGLKESEAYIVESSIIDLLTYEDFQKQDIGHLSNIQSGHLQSTFGIKTLVEIEEYYGAEEYNLEPKVQEGINFIAIKLNSNRLHEEYADDLFKQTSFCWRVNLDRANECHYVLAMVNGIVRDIFPCHHAWRHTIEDEIDPKYPQDKNRHCFGRIEPQNPQELGELKKELIGKRIKGLHNAQNAIAYFDQQKYNNKK